ncbi:MAG: SCO2322 family protein [Candidatus Nanopelagicales bacterium]|nr:SCO2322 family protein [Candidatus Nanopelagicales bacterium]
MLHSARAFGVIVLALTVSGLLLAPGARAESGYRYWTFWVSEGENWRFATEGPATTRTSEGDVFGWRFAITTATATKDAQPSISAPAAFAKACADVSAPEGEHRLAIVIDYGSADQAPEDEVPPTNRIECVLALDGSTAAQSLSTIANLRVDQGFVCGVDGYPESECAPVVELPVVELPVIESPALESMELAESTLSSEDNSSGGLPISLIAFAITVFVVLMGLAVLLTRKKART